MGQSDSKTLKIRTNPIARPKKSDQSDYGRSENGPIRFEDPANKDQSGYGIPKT